ncbi:bifunctional hydroxymethylpyrimidine kinase/phosphomethylpyrimidine kinase [uncultured Aquabacterium sp.]|uniref:bifunctional hydroxymethylpyrimidine kinase/phosphomethylpyrimidine kinase n=1 Tax=uncultured Aquabacterium sp. TaxID=158753 RepID=UPI002639E2A5|nr:bifunctional hydroxymethylpyrimidine kinase/phosphomethylpyrimidine kinase [uncultured Aquabacterium sp.]
MTLDSTPTAAARPVVWSIAGLDPAGGAGLSADQRAADALGVHLCPVAAVLTAQHSQGVTALFSVPPEQLHAQLAALAEDLPPRVIKTGLLGSVAAVQAVARWVDHFRAQTPPGADPHRQLALVVDPVLGASAGGVPFSTEAVLEAYRQWLLPRATVVTPNRAEARRLLKQQGGHTGSRQELPALAVGLMGLGARSVVITGGDAPPHAADDSHPGWCLDWLASVQAHGWLCARRIDTPHHHGTGCTFATGVAAAWALGHVEADAIVLAHMLTRDALAASHVAGQGAGPVKARAGFASPGRARLPWLGLGDELPWQLSHAQPVRETAPGTCPAPLFAPFRAPCDGLYGILPDSQELGHALNAGLRLVQLRHKAREGLDAHLAHSLSLCAERGAQLFVNDHWRDALALPPRVSAAPGFRLGLHLGQEDLLALSAADKAMLLAERDRVMLGLSSHSLWELSRAAGCGASLIACGPVMPTTTKDMPWRPQGEHNLRWWVEHSPAPVVAIGGLLTPQEVARFAACGPAAVCVVRGLGEGASEMAARAPALRAAAATPRDGRPTPALPAPVLDTGP